MHCSVHDIAGGPDGRCAICHAEARAAERREGARLGWVLFLILGTASAALLGVNALARRAGDQVPLAHAEPRPRVERPTSVSPPPPESAAPELAPPSAVVAEAPSELAPEPAREAPPPPAEPTPAPAPLAAGSAAPAKPAPSPADLRAALLSTPITMYTATWCGACQRAHAFLQANGLTCKDLDIDRTPGALRELKTRTGATTIPVLEVDGRLLRAGFSERAVERALAESVERRLGVTGVSIRPTAL
jgi:glutaredoxin